MVINKLNLRIKNIEERETVDFVVQELNKIKKNGTKVIALIGGSGSGKTTISSKLKDCLKDAETLSIDDYVVGDRKYRRQFLENGDPVQKYNPETLNQHIKTICDLKPGESFKVPSYDEQTGIGLDAGKERFTHSIGKIDFLIIEGDFLFVKNPDYIIYMDVTDQIRKINRVSRDLEKRGEPDVETIVKNFEHRQKTQHQPYTEPVKKIADMILEVKAGKKTGNWFKYRYNIYTKES